jgi:homoserine kinase
MHPVPRRIRIRVPCSTSNLGAGFDAIGLAFQRHINIEFTRAEEPGFSFNRLGTVARLGDERDAVRATLLRESDRLGLKEIGGDITIGSDIPIGRGLGSSAAATVGGLALARVLAGDREPDRAGLLQIAERVEGHPDNAAPALFGGLVAIARASAGAARAFPLPLSDRIGFAFVAPDYEVATPLARKALPREVEHGVAARGLGRMAALLQGLAAADPELLRIGFQDELHVPYRLPLISGAQHAFDAGVRAGAWAVTISGSGSGLIAVGPSGNEEAVVQAMAESLHQTDPMYAFRAEPDLSGVTVEIEE